MKIKIIFIAALLSSFILTSCSKNFSDVSPVSPDQESFEKNSTQNFPFSNYQEFNEITVKEWNVDPSTGSRGIKVTVDLYSRGISQLFARVELLDGKSSFYYIGKAREIFFMPVKANIRDIKEIKVFGMNTSDYNQHFPYPYMQQFQNLEVKEWNSSRERLEINHYSMIGNIIHKFVYLQTVEGNIMVFVGNPESRFIIPRYGDRKIISVTMFGYSRNGSRNSSL